MGSPCVYMLSNRRNGVLYLGVTSDLARRIDEHRAGTVSGFSKRYNLHRLVWVEVHNSISEAIAREKQLKKWRRQWKIELIESMNPEWRDLAAELSW